MYVRLGFSVLAHMDPDILIVDEVLAVGDVRFQKKCMGKMEDVGQHGRTVILVSHDMQAITRLCKRLHGPHQAFLRMADSARESR
jgi:lipopolysaccharide transport system ATP-binding protein